MLDALPYLAIKHSGHNVALQITVLQEAIIPSIAGTEPFTGTINTAILDNPLRACDAISSML
jgi:hypothetical protein